MAFIARKKLTTQKKLHKAVNRTSLEIVQQMLALATSGFSLVAALAWNSFIQELVNAYVKKFLPANSGIISLAIYAIIVTVLAVLVTLQLTKLKERLELRQE